MKRIRASFGLALLLPAVALAASPCAPPPTVNTGKVKIEVDPDTGAATPDTCRVKSGTVVVWHGKKSFATKFSASPDKGGGTGFKSSHVLFDHEEAKFTAKDVQSEETFAYDVTTDKASADPAIIIDPK